MSQITNTLSEGVGMCFLGASLRKNCLVSTTQALQSERLAAMASNYENCAHLMPHVTSHFGTGSVKSQYFSGCFSTRH